MNPGKSTEVTFLERKSTCRHAAQTKPVPANGVNVQAACETCGHSGTTKGDNSVCLICYKVYCGSNSGKYHLQAHQCETEHPISLHLNTLAPNCIICFADLMADAHQNVMEAVSAAVQSKFGVTNELESLDNYVMSRDK